MLKTQAYNTGNDTVCFDEMLRPDFSARECYRTLFEWLQRQSPGGIRAKQAEADAIFRRLGITFAVYGAAEANERLIPFDLIPRVISAAEWRFLERGIEQRVRALNAFLHDIYHRQEIVRAGRIPSELVNGNSAFLPQMMGFDPPRGVYSHIIGTDIVRTEEDGFFVLEDNLRTPSGVSYMLENRETMMHLFPELFAAHRVAPVERYPELLRQTLQSVAPSGCDGEPAVAVLTPGIYNSAYFEHAFLADQMGVELVQGSDLVVEDGALWMRTIRGRARGRRGGCGSERGGAGVAGSADVRPDPRRSAAVRLHPGARPAGAAAGRQAHRRDLSRCRHPRLRRSHDPGPRLCGRRHGRGGGAGFAVRFAHGQPG